MSVILHFSDVRAYFLLSICVHETVIAERERLHATCMTRSVIH